MAIRLLIVNEGYLADVRLGSTDEIHVRRLDVLYMLTDREFVRPFDAGGESGTHHSRDLLYLVNKGFAEKIAMETNRRPLL